MEEETFKFGISDDIKKFYCFDNDDGKFHEITIVNDGISPLANMLFKDETLSITKGNKECNLCLSDDNKFPDNFFERNLTATLKFNPELEKAFAFTNDEHLILTHILEKYIINLEYNLKQEQNLQVKVIKELEDYNNIDEKLEKIDKYFKYRYKEELKMLLTLWYKISDETEKDKFDVEDEEDEYI